MTLDDFLRPYRVAGLVGANSYDEWAEQEDRRRNLPELERLRAENTELRADLERLRRVCHE